MANDDVERFRAERATVSKELLQHFTELAWAAGFFDGEGGFYINKGIQEKNQKWRLQTSIKQVDIRPLERFQKAVGCGSIGGPYRGNLAYHQGQYRWSAYCDNAERVAEILKPYLSEPKSEQLAKAMANIEENNHKRKSDLIG